ncbi:DUF1479-domain-containing protein [Crepidotus variabilis]|uniref:DUF1479-domain-containing protein n=1 Tax=Crepidotus variabilis TaxID=179855 RepID=A0A9P6EP61_9AGAR|nr:DUF1479-domain-containing protein [Crepidotus variabilis]
MQLGPKFAELKATIASSYPNFEANVTNAWAEILAESDKTTKTIKEQGTEYVPQVSFTDLPNLSEDEIEKIRRRGTVVIKDVVDDKQAAAWKDELKQFIQTNPSVQGVPADDPQFFELYWTKPQVEARSHPNLLAATVWLSNLYHFQDKESASKFEGVNVNVPLTYADRFRIRRGGFPWAFHPPHVDGGTIERWEDPTFRGCFREIFSGNWRAHDPYELEARLNARSSLYGRPNQSSIFRTFQGWLAMSEIAPTQGTLKVFPDVFLSNVYTILRPFFTPLVPVDSSEIFDPKNWKFDLSTSEFHGISPRDGGFLGPRPTPESHPNMRLEDTMVSVPKVKPGDAVFWHCDVVHAVESEHTGTGDSAVMYIPAVPLTPQNLQYVQSQKESFLKGQRPSDFPKGPDESGFVGVAGGADITSKEGLIAMGLESYSKN